MKYLMNSKGMVVLLAAIAALVLVPVFTFQDLERPHVTYATYEVMVVDGAMARGWIPAFVPPSATDFEECHNLDTNASWLRFSVPKEALPNIKAQLSVVGRDAVMFPKYPPGEWRVRWPHELTEGGSESVRYSIHTYDYTSNVGGVKRSERDFVAIDESSGTVWHWRP
jgi:hypothetical protein